MQYSHKLRKTVAWLAFSTYFKTKMAPTKDLFLHYDGDLVLRVCLVTNRYRLILFCILVLSWNYFQVTFIGETTDLRGEDGCSNFARRQIFYCQLLRDFYRQCGILSTQLLESLLNTSIFYCARGEAHNIEKTKLHCIIVHYLQWSLS